MSSVVIDNHLTPEDGNALRELFERTNPGVPVPEFGKANTETMVMRDEQEPSKIIGFIFMEHALEVRAIVTDPSYKLRAQALSHAFTAMETRIRCGDLGGGDRYYVSIPKEHKHVLKFYDNDGAVNVDQGCVRYMKIVGGAS